MTSPKTFEDQILAANVIDTPALLTGWSKRQKNGFQFQRLQVLDRPWQYRGEGNSKIVVALEDDLRVVRLSKVKAGERCPENWKRQKKRIEREVVFASHAFGPIIGQEFVGSVRPVQLSSSVIQELNESISGIRPDYRLHKELGIPYATSHIDFARIHSYSHPSSNPDFCIEIKAKQGCWSKYTLGGISTLCTYCLNQFLKLSTGKIARRSNYCPMDLFSGTPSRMIRSVIGLVENPQNNFRIFRDGALVYGEHCYESLESVLQEWISPCVNGDSSPTVPSTSSDLNNMLYLICMALIKPHPGLSGTGSPAQKLYTDLKRELGHFLAHPNLTELNGLKPTSGCSCSPDSDPLPEGSILSRILVAQILGKWVGGSIYSLFQKICPYHLSHPSSNDTECPSKKCLEQEIWLDEIEESLIQANCMETLSIERYLLAATAKDCSIMITFSRISEEERIKKRKRNVGMTQEDNENFWILEDLKGTSYKVRIGVADLDPKPVTAIARHYFRDLDMIRAHQTIIDKVAVCNE